MKMELAALISSIIAIIVSLISGAFALAAAKRTAKAQTAQSYIAILQKKVDTLSEYIKTTVQISSPSPALTDLTQSFERIWHICEDEAHLFTECESKFQAMELTRHDIKKSRDQALLLAGEGQASMAQKALLDMIPYVIDFDKLLKEERTATMKKIETLSIK